MRKFTENKPLLASIKANDINEIKRTLIDNIFFLQGNLDEINKAVEYALRESHFYFEEHQVFKVSDKNNQVDYFSEEKGHMRKNYSRERYDLLVELYNKTLAKQEYTYESDSLPRNKPLVNKFVVSGAVIIASYLIFKALS
jgi:hypothetical protein